MGQLLFYLFAFCRIVVVLTFSLSFWSKVSRFSRFEHTIINFRLLPRRLSKVAGYIVIVAEGTVVILTILGGELMAFGFGLAVLLLTVFSLALLSLLARNIHTSCNCFGLSGNSVSPFDIWRNVNIGVFALVGLSLMVFSGVEEMNLGFLEWIFVGISAITSLAIFLNLRYIVEIFRPN